MKGLTFSANLVRDAAGIWVAPTQVMLSYPADGHQQYFAVEDRSFWFAHRNACILAALRQFPPAGPVLDIGGGNGFVTRGMIDAGFPAILLEPGRTGAFNAKTRRNIPDVVCTTLEDAGLQDDSVAAAGLFDVLEHIENDDDLLKAVHARLEPGGLLYLTVPAYASLWSTSDIYAGHHRRYHPRRLGALLGGHFDILFATCFFRPLALPIWAFRALPFRLGLKRLPNARSIESEHGLHGGFLLAAVRLVLQREVRRIESGRSRKWGTSCLVVARKAIPPPRATPRA